MHKRYRKELEKALLCGARTRKKLLDQFDAYCRQALEDLPSPTYEQMIACFGPPDVFAEELMREVSTDELKAFQKKRKHVLTLGIAAAIIWTMLTGYVLFLKSIPIEVRETTVIGEAIEDTSEQEGFE